ncbi:MAG: calcium/proton exchanger [Anaerolineae bacterium]
MKYIKYAMLVFVPLAILSRYLGWSPFLVFAAACLGIVPLASWLGTATEELAARTGPRLGGLLNATLGNAAELIITLVALRAGALNPELREGLNELVKASITGSILGNVLLILGLSILLGGLKNNTQRFDRRQAGVNSTMLILAVIALGVPSLFGYTIEAVDLRAEEYFSIGVAIMMMIVYALSIIYAFSHAGGNAGDTEGLPKQETDHHAGNWSPRLALGVLAMATLFIAWLSEVLVGAVEPVVTGLGISEFFLGIILIPLVGNVAEHIVGVQVAIKNRMELSLAISLGSSLQIALFVAPVLVFAGLLMGNPLTLIFNQFELIALVGGALIAALIALDGESNWLEGAQLLVVYVIIGMAFFFLPT